MTRALKPKKDKTKLYNPAICQEIARTSFIRNFLPIEDNAKEFKFEMTNGLGFDKFMIEGYLLYVGKAKLPVISCAFKPNEFIKTHYFNKLAMDLGITVTVGIQSVVAMIKLSEKNDNSFNMLRMYDFINAIYLLNDMKQQIIEGVNV